MEHVDTLVVFATNRGSEVAADLLDAVRWCFSHSYHVVCVDDIGDVELFGEDVTVIHSTVERHKHFSGFKNNEAIRHAIAADLDFDAVLCLDDDTLPIGRGLDAWALDVLDETACDLLGVADRVDYRESWPAWNRLFTRWVPEAANFAPCAEGVFYSCIWLSRYLALDLHARNLLVPPDYQKWMLWPDVWISWMAQALGHHIVTWGTMDMPRPPLYANHPDTMRSAPQPWILHPAFMVYHSTRSVPGCAEVVVRQHYRRLRHVPAAERSV